VEWYKAFINAIHAGIDKLRKYYPRKLSARRLEELKPWILATYLDPRYKTTPFQRGGVCYSDGQTEPAIRELVKAEFLRYVYFYTVYYSFFLLFI